MDPVMGCGEGGLGSQAVLGTVALCSGVFPVVLRGPERGSALAKQVPSLRAMSFHVFAVW